MANIRAYRLVETLQDRGHDVLLTGGLAVEGWSGRDFKTADWDIVGGPYVDIDAVIEELQKLGYQKHGNVWVLKEEGLPPQNPGQFLTTQYPWGKTHRLRILDHGIEIETVAPEWLYVDRINKVRRGRVDYAEQGLFIYRRFAVEGPYNWDASLTERIADGLKVPRTILSKKFLEERSGLGN